MKSRYVCGMGTPRMKDHVSQDWAEARISKAMMDGETKLNLSGLRDSNLDSVESAQDDTQLLRDRLLEVPNSISRLTQLKKLNLSHNQLGSLPEWISQLTQLESLDLSCNQLTSLPESIGELKRLKTLIIASNRLETIPVSIGQLVSLHTIVLDQNRIESLPESLGQLKRLNTISVDRNRLSSIPESIGMLDRLQTLSIVNNQLTQLPNTIGGLSHLQSLDIRQNQLASLPETIGQLEKLTELHLWKNQLKSLPTDIDCLVRLQLLDADSNQLESLPESIGALKALQTLYLGNNRLKTLPDSLRDLPLMHELYLHDNDQLGIPVEILGQSWDRGIEVGDPLEILEYYFNTRGKLGSQLRELKLLVVGRGGVGKTSLIKRLHNQPIDPTERETHGINITPVELPCNDGPVIARVWDFGGQHVLHAMHEFFLTERSLYLLVLGEREDMAEQDAAYWLQLIRSYAGNAPVVVAINKSEGRKREIDRKSFERNYGPILAWIPTECSAGFDETIENLRSALVSAANEMDEIRNLFPAKWWKIKDSLEHMQEPFLNFSEYQQLCAELGESDSKNQANLAGWLNDLGIAINYADDERLHDTTVLRPDWLAGGIYAILRANDPHHNDPFARDAIISFDRLEDIYDGAERLGILTADEYPKQKWPFLLQWMCQFQLAFPLDECGKQLLVPTLLSVEPPRNCTEPEVPDRTRIRFEFDVVPGPLLPKFLVRTFSLIDGECRWRRGAILQYGSASARVWSTQDERWIRVTAIGNDVDRFELLTMIRLTLHDLFREYKNLKVTEQWEYDEEWVPLRTLRSIGLLPRDDENFLTGMTE